jgi:hypothetical protein
MTTTTQTDCSGGVSAPKVALTSVCSDHSLQGVTTIRIGARTITCTHDPPVALGGVHDPFAIGPDPDPDAVPSCA